MDKVVTKTKSPTALILLAAILCVGQLIWFGSKALHQIDFDGMTYTGIAAELRRGAFRDSINAFRSPLISWLIAIVPQLTVLQAGKCITILTFLSVVALLYVFTDELWSSRIVASIAVFLLVLARGVSYLAVAFVTPDFLVSALVLTYFLVLLRLLRKQKNGWWTLGAVHGLAFLAKAIALPWLAVCTFTAAIFSNGGLRTRFVKLASAAIIPVMVSGLWGVALQTKYGVLTTGSQFKANLLQWTLRGIVPNQPAKYKMLRDVAPHMTGSMVYDPMPPGQWGWYYHPPTSAVVPRILAAEARNVPAALKEMTMLSTPGILLAIVGTCIILYRSQYGSPEWILAITALAGSAVLILAYSMLVIDGRYLLPLVPLYLAIGSKFLMLDQEFEHKTLRVTSVALVICGVGFSFLYWASPFRIQTRDWQVVCYEAGDSLRRHQAKTLVTLGSGPFPEHGVGWEAGYTSSYFGETQLIAASDSVPKNLANLTKDISQASPDAVLVWHTDEQVRAPVRRALGSRYPDIEMIMDPVRGAVGMVLYRSAR